MNIQFNKDKVILLCANCHLKQQANVFYEYKDLILQKNIFSLKTKEINQKIFDKTSHIPEKLERMHIRQKIREWMKTSDYPEWIFQNDGSSEFELIDKPAIKRKKKKKGRRKKR